MAMIPSSKASIGRRKEPRKEKKHNSVELVRFPALQGIPWLVHGFSTRLGGISEVYGGRSLNLAFTEEDTRDAVKRNRELLLASLPKPKSGPGRAGPALGHWELITLRQIHSAVIWEARAGESVEVRRAGDGLITSEAGVLLAIKTADCIPVILADVRHKVVGAFHAGWRGTVARIVEKGLGEMQRRFASDPRDIRAA